MYQRKPDLPQRLTVEEYFAFDETTDIRHEYDDGFLIEMSGGTPEHALIKDNTRGAINHALRGRGCLVVTSDLKVQANRARSYRFPDVVVVCGDLAYYPGRRDTVTNPILLVEVLSESTAAIDTRDKFYEYFRIESLRAYLVLDQFTPSADLYFRESDEQWPHVLKVDGLEATIPLTTLDITLSMAELYEGVTFEDDTAADDETHDETADA